MNTDEQKNISITLSQPDDKNKGPVISFEYIFSMLKRFLALWIVLSIAFGIITAGVVLILSRTTSTDTIQALISYNYSGIEKGLAPNGKTLDVNKVKSPSIIEEALSFLNEPTENVETVRRNISINGVIPNDALDKISLYQHLYTKSGNIDTANALLNVDYFPTYYTVEFDSSSAGYDMESGKNIIDEILNCYQSYFFKTYGYNEALGNSLAGVNYKDYDYPAAVDIFRITLDDLDRYVTNLSENDSTDFRSSRTGYNFDDILRNINTLREADLDTVSSYITINNITNDRDRLITYYEYRIENLKRDAEVTKAELDTISKSIEEYRKDSMMIFGDVNRDEENSYSQVSEKYDSLIKDKINALDSYTSKQQTIEYYQARLEAVTENETETNSVDDEVIKRLDSIYKKIENLINITEETSDDYYENVVFENAFNILVPATGEQHIVQLGSFALPLIGIEGVLFAAYIIASVIMAIIQSNKVKSEVEAI